MKKNDDFRGIDKAMTKQILPQLLLGGPKMTLFIIGKTAVHAEYFIKRLVREKLLEGPKEATIISGSDLIKQVRYIRRFGSFVIVLHANYDGPDYEEMFLRFAALRIKNISVDDQISIPKLKEAINNELNKA